LQHHGIAAETAGPLHYLADGFYYRDYRH
jgi:hypothetical protein